jgi:hypothetical protein
VLTLSIDEGGDGGDGWAVDFLTVRCHLARGCGARARNTQPSRRHSSRALDFSAASGAAGRLGKGAEVLVRQPRPCVARPSRALTHLLRRLVAWDRSAAGRATRPPPERGAK